MNNDVNAKFESKTSNGSKFAVLAVVGVIISLSLFGLFSALGVFGAPYIAALVAFGSAFGLIGTGVVVSKFATSSNPKSRNAPTPSYDSSLGQGKSTQDLTPSPTKTMSEVKNPAIPNAKNPFDLTSQNMPIQHNDALMNSSNINHSPSNGIPGG